MANVEPVNGAAQTLATLAEFWKECIEVDSVTGDDRMLELGGNSLVATMIANRIELQWGVRPSLREIFTCTLIELAERCEERRRSLTVPGGDARAPQ